MSLILPCQRAGSFKVDKTTEPAAQKSNQLKLEGLDCVLDNLLQIRLHLQLSASLVEDTLSETTRMIGGREIYWPAKT